MEDVPFDVIVDYPETGDLSDQTGQDIIDAARAVEFEVKSVEPRVRSDKDTGERMTASLNVRVAIGPLGTDGQGKYANKNLFADLLTWYNEETYTSDWWKKQARFPYKAFLQAMGLDPKNPPKVSDEFCMTLKGGRFIADITRPEIRQKGADGKYQGTGTFKNELTNFKKIP